MHQCNITKTLLPFPLQKKKSHFLLKNTTRVDWTWPRADNSDFPHEGHYLCGTGLVSRSRRTVLKHKQPRTGIVWDWFGFSLNPLPLHVITSSSLQERFLCALNYCTTQMNYIELLIQDFWNYNKAILVSKLWNRMKAFKELFNISLQTEQHTRNTFKNEGSLDFANKQMNPRLQKSLSC